MKKLFILASIAVTSCSTPQLYVELLDGKVINIDKPDVPLIMGDTLVIRQFIPSGWAPISHSFYGYYKGVLPSNPDPCTTLTNQDSTTSTFCEFYLVGTVIK